MKRYSAIFCVPGKTPKADNAGDALVEAVALAFMEDPKSQFTINCRWVYVTSTQLASMQRYWLRINLDTTNGTVEVVVRYESGHVDPLGFKMATPEYLIFRLGSGLTRLAGRFDQEMAYQEERCSPIAVPSFSWLFSTKEFSVDLGIPRTTLACSDAAWFGHAGTIRTFDSFLLPHEQPSLLRSGSGGPSPFSNSWNLT
jgi:hypothetical protein